MAWAVLAVVSLLVAPVWAQGAGITIEAQSTRSSVYVGDEVTYQVVVRGGRPARTPEVAFPASVRAQEAGVSDGSRTMVRIINGRRETVTDSNITYMFRVTALEPGTVTIPPATVTIPGQGQFTTEPVVVEVLLPQVASGFSLTADVERRDVYLGETVTAEVTWTITENVGNFDFDTSVIDPSLTVAPGTPGPGTRDLVEFRFRGQRAFGVRERVFEAGGEAVRFRFWLRITPTEVGPADFGPLRVVFDREAPGSRRVRSYVETDPMTLRVRPLPTEGRPDGFGGLIGRYELSATASPTAVNVGDPITLRAVLTGAEPMTGAESLDALTHSPGFEAFRISSEGWREQQPREAGRRVFTTTVRALSDEVEAVPPVRVSSFDPEAGEYVMLASEPIPLDVRAVREATLADAQMAPGSAARPGRAAGPASEPIGPGDPAFWAAPTLAEIDAASGFRFWSRVREPWVVAALATGPGAVLAAGVLVLATRRRAEPRAQRDRALRRAEHLVVRSGLAAGVRAAGAAVLGCEPEALTTMDLRRLPVEAGVVAPLCAALEAEEAPADRRVGARPVDAAGTRAAIRSLRRSVRRVPVVHGLAGRGGAS